MLTTKMTTHALRAFNLRWQLRFAKINSKCVQTATFPNICLYRLQKWNRLPPLPTTSLLMTQQSANMCSGGIRTIDYSGVKGLESNKTLLIDVREPKELEDSGVLPGSVNIPLGKLEKALKDMNDDEFKKLYGKSKPSMDFPLVFSCLSGIRSQKASELATKLGYKNVRNYLGGWSDWEKNGK